MTTRWKVTFNDGNRVVLQQETDEAISEAEIQRPNGTDANEWQTRWPVGAEFGEDEYLDKVRFEELRRRVGLNKSEQYAVSHWNRPDPAKKRHHDWLFTLALPVLGGIKQTDCMKTTWLHTYAKQLYLGLSSKHPDIAMEYLNAISRNEAALLNFIEKYGDPSWVEPTDDEIRRLEEQLEREGLDWKGKDVKSN